MTQIVQIKCCWTHKAALCKGDGAFKGSPSAKWLAHVLNVFSLDSLLPLFSDNFLFQSSHRRLAFNLLPHSTQQLPFPPWRVFLVPAGIGPVEHVVQWSPQRVLNDPLWNLEDRCCLPCSKVHTQNILGEKHWDPSLWYCVITISGSLLPPP